MFLFLFRGGPKLPKICRTFHIQLFFYQLFKKVLFVSMGFYSTQTALFPLHAYLLCGLRKLGSILEICGSNYLCRK